MPIYTLDITGFYYEIDVELPPNPTVLDIVREAAGTTAPNGGVLSFQEENDFVTRLTVEYSENSSPKSRQISFTNTGKSFASKSKGRYSYTTGEGTPTVENGGVPGILAWQYYVFAGDRLLNGSLAGTPRF
ncbi:MAG: hypothetical protein AAFR27_13625, partial [Pseudomonadota bacterium]